MFDNTTITAGPGFWEYRKPSGGGVLVVRVYKGADVGDVRISSSVEYFRPTKIIEPTALKLSEIKEFLKDAFSRWNLQQEPT